jgi:hypothetical protein
MSKSLVESLLAPDAVDEILLSLNSPKGCNLVYVLVEGKNDCRLYQKFFDNEKTSIGFVGGGKVQVEKALMCLAEKAGQVLGICDADFRHLEEDYSEKPNLFFTDCHDIEMTMLNDKQTRMNAFTEYGIQNGAEDVLENSIGGSVFVGYARWFNDVKIVKLRFRGLSIAPYYDIPTKTFNSTSFLDGLNKCSPNKKRFIGITDIDHFKNANKTSDFFNLCNGHDVIALIVAIIKVHPSHKNLSTENFARVLRASYMFDSFKKTNLFADISAWQIANRRDIFWENER